MAAKKKAKHFIQAMGMKKGALHAEMGVPQGQKIPPDRLAAAAQAPGLLGKRARLAETLRGLNHGGKKKKKGA
jgi:hypothetical protein